MKFMTEDEIRLALESMEKEFGKLPNPEHEPRRFAYYVKLWRYAHEKMG
jgi:hypothetical protein